jgi:cytochrome oxidase Cu insertion factor (SCO1/SenC/PrrC family)
MVHRPSQRMIGALAVAGAVALAGAIVLSQDAARGVDRPASASLRGDIVWAPAHRHAPAIDLAEESGRGFSLLGERGHVVVLTFLASRCRGLCPIESRLLAHVARALPVAERPDVVVVSVDPAGDTAASIRKARLELRGMRRISWLVGSHARLARVWREYGIVVKPVPGDIEHTSVVYLIDRQGDERVGMLFPFSLPSLSHDLRLLAAEKAV